ncbi:hypothetical protein KAR91_77185 [Candidatus Pacearchaeota archaeon]|nr:hypothetical protein [Candidatus Pacearchaeota archaeon]
MQVIKFKRYRRLIDFTPEEWTQHFRETESADAARRGGDTRDMNIHRRMGNIMEALCHSEFDVSPDKQCRDCSSFKERRPDSLCWGCSYPDHCMWKAKNEN